MKLKCWDSGAALEAIGRHCALEQPGFHQEFRVKYKKAFGLYKPCFVVTGSCCANGHPFLLPLRSQSASFEVSGTSVLAKNERQTRKSTFHLLGVGLL